MSPDPRFAVVIPVHDGASTLARAVGSVLAQRAVAFELVVVDDGSGDDVQGVLDRFTDPRLSVRRQTHAGVSAARNLGVAATTAPVVTFLDADDEALPGWLERLAEGFGDPACDISCCGAERVFPRRVRVRMPVSLGAEFGRVTGQFLAGTFAVRRELFDDVGGYVSGLSYGENTELFLRLVTRTLERGHRVAAVHEALVRTYSRGRGPSGARAQYEGARYMLARHGEVLRRNPRTEADLCSTAGVAAARLGDSAGARRFLARAARANPSMRAVGRLAISLVPPAARRVWARPAPVPLPGDAS